MHESFGALSVLVRHSIPRLRGKFIATLLTLECQLNKLTSSCIGEIAHRAQLVIRFGHEFECDLCFFSGHIREACLSHRRKL